VVHDGGGGALDEDDQIWWWCGREKAMLKEGHEHAPPGSFSTFGSSSRGARQGCMNAAWIRFTGLLQI
jgi:hypothetical protein